MEESDEYRGLRKDEKKEITTFNIILKGRRRSLRHVMLFRAL